MIVYLIQAHKNLEQLIVLVAQLSGRNNICLLNLDPRLRSEAGALERTLSLRGLPNIIVRTGAPISWGGISQVYALLDSMAFALSIDARWDFLVNLSGDSLALESQDVIGSFYRSALNDGKQAHLSFFGPGIRVSDFAVLPWGNADSFTIEYTAQKLYGRIEASIQREFLPMFADRIASPLFRWRNRCSLHVTDLVGERKLVIRALTPYEAEYRKTCFQEQRLFGGRAWFTLPRATVETMLGDSFMSEIVHRLEHFFCPDELFLQTYFKHSRRFAPEQISPENQRFRRGDIVKIQDSMLDELFASGTFFARKIDTHKCPLIRDRMLAMGNRYREVAG